MKITLNLNDTLIANAKALAAQQRTNLTRLIEEGLQLRLRATQGKARTTAIPVYRGKGGLLPGLNPARNKSLREAADDHA